MAKPDILILPKYKPLIPDPKKFGTITEATGLATMGFPGEKSKAVFIRIIEIGDDSRGEFVDTLARLSISEYLQIYIIFDSEYGWVKRRVAPELLFSSPNVKTLFCKNVPAAVAYGCGLLEKAAKHGVWA